MGIKSASITGKGGRVPGFPEKSRKSGARAYGPKKPRIFPFALSEMEDEYISKASMDVNVSKAEFCRRRIFLAGWQAELGGMGPVNGKAVA